MNKQNEMMNFIWLLNAAFNSAFETKELFLEFLKYQQDFRELRQRIPANTPQRDFLEKEIQQNLEHAEDLKKKIQEVIDILRHGETEQ